MLIAAVFSSCHSSSYPRRTAATGALIGAGTGALIGSSSGNAGKGALIGATVGAVAGGAYGKHKVKRYNTYHYPYGYNYPVYGYAPIVYRSPRPHKVYRYVPAYPSYY